MSLIRSVVRKHMPRRYRKEDVPSWSIRCQELYEEFQNNNDPEIPEDFIISLGSSGKEKWHRMVETLNFQHGPFLRSPMAAHKVELN